MGHGKDTPRNGTELLTPIEEIFLSNIVTAFWGGGLFNDNVSSKVITRANILWGILCDVYQAAEDTKLLKN